MDVRDRGYLFEDGLLPTESKRRVNTLSAVYRDERRLYRRLYRRQP